MSTPLEILFAPLSDDPETNAAVLFGQDLTMGPTLEAMNAKSGSFITKAAEAADFKGKAKTSIELLAPPKLSLQRLVVIGAGKTQTADLTDWAQLGGYAFGQLQARKAHTGSLILDLKASGTKAEVVAAEMAFGALLRQYSFKKYLTKQQGGSSDEAKDGNAEGEAAKPAGKNGLERLVIHCADPDKARHAFEHKRALASGIRFARDLVNEPANALGPVEFADRIKALESSGLEIEILDEAQLKDLKMDTLLSVSQGSVRPARVAVLQWNGAKSKRAKPLAFVGKGVVFDSGGYSIKPAAGMEDMKGDMGGAACVVGLMLSLAERKAPVNAVGLVGLVENMVSGNATRPGDIVTSMSGQTVEILNTDAEGRLVLADVLWYAQERFKPRFVIDLATLTGAIMVALGKEYAGLFANDDKLADQIQQAAKVTGEKVWRMPLDKAYHRMIDSKNADVKNIGGRWGGSCTAAAFLERFIKNDVPWAHLDVAGTAMDASKSEINTSWGSGWGIQLLDRLVVDQYEKAS